MTQYELPDGFQGMETAPKDGVARVRCNVVYSNGAYGVDFYPYDCESVGWAPIVPLKRKARFVVRESPVHGPFVIEDEKGPRHCAFHLPTRESAQRIADIYNEVMP